MALIAKILKEDINLFPLCVARNKTHTLPYQIFIINEFWQSISPDSFISVFGKYERRV
jgi:hypothetical protein